MFREACRHRGSGLCGKQLLIELYGGNNLVLVFFFRDIFEGNGCGGNDCNGVFESL